jgi:DNA-binding PadR family transcriptional regulator
MPKSFVIGELEQIVLLALLRVRDAPYARSIHAAITEVAPRSISRGALYRTLDRLEGKGYLVSEVEAGPPERGGMPRRRYQPTPAGIAVLQEARGLLQRLWAGLDTFADELEAES